MSKIGKCALCLKQDVLRSSHVIPKFAASWIKRVSPTPYLRKAVEPNRRIQDVLTQELLCGDCEQLLSKNGEHPFAQHIFHPFHESKQIFHYLNYDDWLLYFSVSLSWRVVATQIEGFRYAHPKLAQYADIAMEDWRLFLLGKQSDPGPCQHHVFFFGMLEDADAEVPEQFHAYTLLELDATICWSNSSVASYTKLPGMFFWTTIFPFEASDWNNTLIDRRGVLCAPQSPPSNSVGFLMDRLSVRNRLINEISPNQRQKIAKEVDMALGRTKDTPTHRARDADRRWRRSLLD